MRAMSEPTTAFVVMTILLIGCRHPEPIQKPREADGQKAEDERLGFLPVPEVLVEHINRNDQ